MVVVKVLQAAAAVVVLAVLVESVLPVAVVLLMFSVSSSVRGDLHTETRRVTVVTSHTPNNVQHIQTFADKRLRKHVHIHICQNYNHKHEIIRAADVHSS